MHASPGPKDEEKFMFKFKVQVPKKKKKKRPTTRKKQYAPAPHEEEVVMADHHRHVTPPICGTGESPPLMTKHQAPLSFSASTLQQLIPPLSIPASSKAKSYPKDLELTTDIPQMINTSQPIHPLGSGLVHLRDYDKVITRLKAKCHAKTQTGRAAREGSESKEMGTKDPNPIREDSKDIKEKKLHKDDTDSNGLQNETSTKGTRPVILSEQSHLHNINSLIDLMNVFHRYMMAFTPLHPSIMHVDSVRLVLLQQDTEELGSGLALNVNIALAWGKIEKLLFL